MERSPHPPNPHQAELDRILELYPDTTSIKSTGFAIFLETIIYRYYCIFMVRKEGVTGCWSADLLSFSNILWHTFT